MQLLALTPAEIAFLSAPAGESDPVCARFTRKLAQTLTARLQLPVQVQLRRAPEGVEFATGTPRWAPDGTLATLWLTRRLGGQRMTGNASSFVPKSLLLTLDASLAECWLDAPGAKPPPALSWRLETPFGEATLGVQLLPEPTDMTRWAREVIRHGH
ncbi:hypothetical protein [Thiobacillus sp.]|uniref:hypothetical protein n=1 Tax=Thiobacillus sp. TaxID=924 RepID=UPI00286DC3A0|nr:hypothetical protein [Thiobacillus sp.]